MNRVKYPEFPDNATDVIWQYIDGVAQFSPIADGRISEVVPSDETKEAVKQALEGVDYSDGALFFIQRSAAAKNNIQWFDKNLKNYSSTVYMNFTLIRRLHNSSRYKQLQNYVIV